MLENINTQLRDQKSDNSGLAVKKLINDRLIDFLSDESLSIQEILTHFLMTLKSKHTQRAYEYDLLQFINFLKANFEENLVNSADLTKITKKHARAWKLNLCHSKKNKGFSSTPMSKTLARKLSSVSSFFQFLVLQKIVTSNPILHLVRPKNNRYFQSSVLSQDESLNLLEFSNDRLKILVEKSTQGNPKLKKSALSRKEKSQALAAVLTIVLLETGIRGNEICRLTLKNFVSLSSDSPCLNLKVKGGHSRNLPISKSCAIAIEQYKTLRENTFLDSKYVFSRTQEVKKHNRLSQVGLSKLICQNSNDCGIFLKISPHGFRATFATRLIAQGVPIADIKDLLGHTSLSTTQLYIRKSVLLGKLNVDLESVDEKIGCISNKDSVPRTDTFLEDLLK